MKGESSRWGRILRLPQGPRRLMPGDDWGFPAVCCMPNTNPVNDNQAITEFMLERARVAGLANVFPIGAITKGSEGKELAEIGDLRRAGCVAISDDGKPVMN